MWSHNTRPKWAVAANADWVGVQAQREQSLGMRGSLIGSIAASGLVLYVELRVRGWAVVLIWGPGKCRSVVSAWQWQRFRGCIEGPQWDIITDFLDGVADGSLWSSKPSIKSSLNDTGTMVFSGSLRRHPTAQRIKLCWDMPWFKQNLPRTIMLSEVTRVIGGVM